MRSNISQEDFLNNVKWTRCYNPNEKWYYIGALDRVNIPCLMHGTRLCQ